MATPQPGIFALGTSSHAYLELDLAAKADPAQAVAAAAGVREPRTTMGGVNLVAGFRPELWASSGQSGPKGLVGYNKDVVGNGLTMPATQHDIVMWLSGPSYDVVFDLSRAVVGALHGYATLAHEIVGWPYHHDRDLTGFIDGTENPTLIEATSVATISPGEPGEGGSILLLQQWEHDIPAWEGLPVAAQEEAIGRRKSDSEEFDPKPPASHVGRTDQDRLGKIFRRNVAYGDVHSHGTVFVGFCARQETLADMLEAMCGLDGGPRDELTVFTRALTGAYYFIPAADSLAALGAGEGEGMTHSDDRIPEAPTLTDWQADIDAERAGWYELAELVRKLTPTECLLPGYYRDPDWTVRDAVAHLGTWLAQAEVHLEQIAAGTYEGHDIDIDALNAEMLAAMHDQPWEVAWTMTNAARTMMLQDWFALPVRTEEAAWWVAKSGPYHYGQHLPRLREWVAELVARRA